MAAAQKSRYATISSGLAVSGLPAPREEQMKTDMKGQPRRKEKRESERTVVEKIRRF